MNPWLFTWRGFAQLGRVSNLPTCLSNLLVGFALAGGWPDALSLTLVVLATSCLYLGGMALNDVVDVGYDARFAGHRPIVAGRIGLRTAVVLAGLLLLLGVGFARPLGLSGFTAATALLIVIVIYDLAHKQFALSVLAMGACRGLVYVLGAMAAGGTLTTELWILAAGISAYTALLTLIASDEDGDLRAMNRNLAWVLPVVALGAGLAVRLDVMTVVGGGLAAVWIVRGVSFVRATPARTVPAILTWLGGISLIDSFYLVALQRYELAAVALVFFAMTVVAHRRILGT